jgi:hypothetical protein
MKPRKPNRKRRLMLWSLGMGMVAAFIQSRLAAARMERGQDDALGGDRFGGKVPVWLQDWAWKDVAEGSQVFGNLDPADGRLLES